MTMSRSLFHLSLLIIGSISQYVRCDNSTAQTSSVVDKFERDWIYKGQTIGISYIRQYPFQREFTFVVRDTTKDYCTVTHVHTDNSTYDFKTCNYEFRDSGGGEVTIERVTSGFESGGEGIGLYWYTQKMKANHELRTGSVNTKWCQPGTIVPKFESEASAAPQNISNVTSLKDTQIKYDEDISDVLESMNFSWVGGLEGPVEVNSTEGIYFLGKKNDSDSKVDAMFMDLSTNETIILDGIENFNIEPGHYRTAREHGKYGQCILDTPRKITCTQQKYFQGHPGMEIFKRSIDLPFMIDWFFMANLKENAIVLITGKCSGKICNSYTVRKLGEYESKVLVDIDNLGVACENPSGLTNDIVDYIGASVFCFHLVCNQKYTDGESGIKMQYRRHCVKRDIITSWS